MIYKIKQNFMKEQNYKNHRQYVFGYHVLTFSLTVVLLAASLYSLSASIKGHYDLRFSVMFVIAAAIFILMFIYIRAFSLKAQDRAIRAEENLRHFILTGKLPDRNLTMSQIIALRFAPDEELKELTDKALKNNLKGDDIKKEIKKWKADFQRV